VNRPRPLAPWSERPRAPARTRDADSGPEERGARPSAPSTRRRGSPGGRVKSGEVHPSGREGRVRAAGTTGGSSMPSLNCPNTTAFGGASRIRCCQPAPTGRWTLCTLRYECIGLLWSSTGRNNGTGPPGAPRPTDGASPGAGPDATPRDATRRGDPCDARPGTDGSGRVRPSRAAVAGRTRGSPASIGRKNRGRPWSVERYPTTSPKAKSNTSSRLTSPSPL
jgi:hypothetical protein